MKKFLFLFFIFFITLFAISQSLSSAFADEIGDLQKQIDQLNEVRQQSINATKPLEGQLDSLKRQLAQIQATLNTISSNINTKEKELAVREDKLAIQQALLEVRVRAYYIRSFLTDPLLVIMSSSHPGELFRELSYRQAATKEDRLVITSITGEVLSLLTEKEKLEKDKARLASLQADVDKNATFLGGEIKKAKDYQSQLSGQIAQLSAKQQALLAAKLASLNIPRSASTSLGGCVDDRGVDPGFSPRFAFFTYGVPNRVGLNQWGAKGRAEAGQTTEQILQAYYSYDSISNSSNVNIHVVGTNNYGQNIDMNIPLEEYLKHIYEMPTAWSGNALKAQVIAARSYVLSYTNNGQGSICPSDSCQVFKAETNDSNWQSAVSQTSGQVMTKGGSPIKAWFSSTHGGYVFSSSDIGWSGTSFTKHALDTAGSVGSFSDLQSTAYDKASPWFYCDWGSRASYNKTAWLKGDEVADIVNVMLLVQRDAGTVSHLTQADKPNPDGAETWDASRVKQELQSRGGTVFNNVSSISVGWDQGYGRTTSVNVSGDGGSTSFDGSSFKQYFNLRAPANIQIVGPLFNIESK